MLAITNATIETAAGAPLQDAAVLVKEGKIEKVGRASDVDVSGYEVIDAAGKVLTPGWIDTHTHLGIDEEGLAWEGADFNETSSPVTPQMRAIDGINPFDQGFRDAASCGVTTVQVLPGSANAIGGLTAIVKVKPNRPLSELVVEEIAGLKMALGENPKNIHGKKGHAPITRMGVASLIRDAFVEAQNYLKLDAARDLKKEALGRALKREIPVCVHAHRADDILTAIRIAEEFELDLHIEHVTEGHLITGELAKYKDKVKFSIGPTLSSRSKVELNQISWDTYRVFAEHGIPFSSITDHPVIPITHLQTSMQQAIKAGLDAGKALRSVTLDAAWILGLDDRKGSIEAGKDADLVLWDSHPLHENGSVRFTMTEGEIVFRREDG